jgi:putative ABC transport system permease protein
MKTTIQDLRYALRLLARTPGFTAVAVLTLALGIGANTAIFTVVNAVVFKALPYRDADRLVMVWQDLRARSGPEDEWLSPGNYADLRAAKDIVADIAVMSGWRPTLLGGAEPEPIPGEVVSYEYFSVLGTAPAIGRNFAQSDDVPNAARVVVISDAFWKTRFGGDRSVVGKTLNLSGESHEIIGVLPAGFRPILNQMAELWRPIRLNVANPPRGSIFLRSVAKLPDGRSIDQARAAATALSSQLQTTYPRFNEKMVFNLMPLKDRVVGDVKAPLLALLGAVGFVLLIACANIANLLLARGSARGRELAVRVALGAGRARVARQLLTESLVLAAIGGVAGVLFGIWGTDALVALAPENTPRLNEIGIEPRVLAFAALVTVVTGLVFGLVPAIQAARGGVTQSLKDGARGAGATGGRTLRRALVGVEVALALVLLTGGLLLLQTFVRLQKTDLGFRPDNVLVGFVGAPRALDTREKRVVFFDQIYEKIRALPGVERAALSSIIPLATGGDNDTSFRIEGRPAPESQSQTPVTWYRRVSASYFDTIGISLVKGRIFAEREATPSVVINEMFVQRYFPGEEPLGRQIRFGSGPDSPPFTIVGVVKDVKVAGALEPKSRVETYVPYWQLADTQTAVVLKTPGDPAKLIAPLRQAIASVDPNVPVANVGPLSEIVTQSIDQPRFIATLAGAFAFLALTLAAIGIYGVMAYTVSQRTTEFGLRMALGAERGEVFRLVLSDALKLTVAGVVVGVGGSYLISRSLRSLEFGITPVDPLTLALTSAALVTVAVIASVVPARRATRVDPMVALRAE